MISLVNNSSEGRLPDADYILEKTDKLFDIISLLTPKFEGKWEFILIDPKIKVIKELLSSRMIPEWIDINVYTTQKKIDEIVLEYPEYIPKQKTRKEMFNEVIATVNHVIDEAAKKALYAALSNKPSELQETLTKLDKECKGTSITLKQVQSVVNYTKRVYASDVLNAFLIGDARRWKLYNSLERELGTEIMYYAIRKQVHLLLQAKEDYLRNKDVKQFIVKRLDAPLICYTYVLFANSTNYNQLYGLMYSIEHRSKESLQMIQKYNI